MIFSFSCAFGLRILLLKSDVNDGGLTCEAKKGKVGQNTFNMKKILTLGLLFFLSFAALCQNTQVETTSDTVRVKIGMFTMNRFLHLDHELGILIEKDTHAYATLYREIAENISTDDAVTALTESLNDYAEVIGRLTEAETQPNYSDQ